MNAEYHCTLRPTFDDYLRERIRRGLQSHYDHTEDDHSSTRSIPRGLQTLCTGPGVTG